MLVVVCGYPGCGRSKAVEYLERKHSLPIGTVDDVLGDDRRHDIVVVSNLNRRSELARIRCMYPSRAVCVVKIANERICLRNSSTSAELDEHTRIPYNFVIDNSGDESKFERDLDELMRKLEAGTLELCRLI
jgi:dephospho-CoA kinase